MLFQVKIYKTLKNEKKLKKTDIIQYLNTNLYCMLAQLLLSSFLKGVLTHCPNLLLDTSSYSKLEQYFNT